MAESIEAAAAGPGRSAPIKANATGHGGVGEAAEQTRDTGSLPPNRRADLEPVAAIVDILDAAQPALPELAAAINAAVRAAEAGVRSAVTHAFRAGALLREAKARIEYGQWEAWLEANCEVAPRTARAYMQLHKKLAELPPESATRVADLPLRDAIKAIATAPVAPPGEPPARAPRDRDERSRVVAKFHSTARSIREASKWVDCGMDVKPRQVATLRNKLLGLLHELDQLQGAAP